MFGKLIDYMMKYTRRCELKERNDHKRSMLVKDVESVEHALLVLKEIYSMGEGQ